MGEVTIGELGRRLEALENRLDGGLRDLHHSLMSLRFVPIDRYDAEQRALERRIDDVESTNRWLARAVAVILIQAVVTIGLTLVVARGGV